MTTKDSDWLGNPWQGKKECDFCFADLNQHVSFYDAATKSYGIGRGRWALMCQGCFDSHGLGLGTGKGQKYSLQQNGQHRKIAG